MTPTVAAPVPVRVTRYAGAILLDHWRPGIEFLEEVADAIDHAPDTPRTRLMGHRGWAYNKEYVEGAAFWGAIQVYRTTMGTNPKGRWMHCATTPGGDMRLTIQEWKDLESPHVIFMGGHEVACSIPSWVFSHKITKGEWNVQPPAKTKCSIVVPTWVYDLMETAWKKQGPVGIYKSERFLPFPTAMGAANASYWTFNFGVGNFCWGQLGGRGYGKSLSAILRHRDQIIFWPDVVSSPWIYAVQPEVEPLQELLKERPKEERYLFQPQLVYNLKRVDPLVFTRESPMDLPTIRGPRRRLGGEILPCFLEKKKSLWEKEEWQTLGGHPALFGAPLEGGPFRRAGPSDIILHALMEICYPYPDEVRDRAPHNTLDPGEYNWWCSTYGEKLMEWLHEKYSTAGPPAGDNAGGDAFDVGGDAFDVERFIREGPVEKPWRRLRVMLEFPSLTCFREWLGTDLGGLSLAWALASYAVSPYVRRSIGSRGGKSSWGWLEAALAPLFTPLDKTKGESPKAWRILEESPEEGEPQGVCTLDSSGVILGETVIPKGMIPPGKIVEGMVIPEGTTEKDWIPYGEAQRLAKRTCREGAPGTLFAKLK